MPQMPPLSDEALNDLLSKPHWAKIATASPNGSIRILKSTENGEVEAEGESAPSEN